jgi:hypothetical protein
MHFTDLNTSAEQSALTSLQSPRATTALSTAVSEANSTANGSSSLHTSNQLISQIAAAKNPIGMHMADATSPLAPLTGEGSTAS